MSYIGRAVVRHNKGQINPSLRFFFGKRTHGEIWKVIEVDFILDWLVVSTPLKNDGLRQLG